MNLNKDEQKIILKLREDPLASVSKIAQELNRSRPTILSQFKNINKKCSVQAIFNLRKLDLKRVNYIFECDFQNIENLEKAMKSFPYTCYHIRVIGPLKGLFVQFSVPKSYSMNNFIHILKNKGLIGRLLDLTPETTPINSMFRLDHYNEDENDFNLNWTNFSESTTNNEIKSTVEKNHDINLSIIDEIEPLDMYILASLSENARKKGIELLSPLGEAYSTKVPSYVVSRRLKFIRENLIEQYLIHLAWELFNIYQPIIFVSNGPYKNSKVNNLAMQIQNNFPFESVFYLINEHSGFFWYVAVPPSHFPSLLSFIWKYSKNNFDLYSLDYRSSKRYLFYGYYNYDFSKREWKVSDEHLFSEILDL